MKAPSLLRWLVPLAATCSLASAPARATEDLDYIVEHLAEVAMNNNAALLPLWQRDWRDARDWRGYVSAGFNAITAQDMDARGHTVGGAIERSLAPDWAIRGVAFEARSTLTGSAGVRPLNPIFLKPLPTGLPATTSFGRFDGRISQFGAGITATWRNHSGWMDGSEWMGGVLWQRLALDDMATTYTVLDGAAAGTRGTIGYDSRYSFFTLLGGMQWHRRYAGWLFSPHWHVSLPLPRAAVAGRFTAPGLDVSGDSAQAGNGHHLGDGYLSLGLSITWLPAHLTVDLGTTLGQALLEPVVDKGIDRDLVLGIEWSF
jgi:hypothetical protein